jgi:hypothetical protein
MRFNNAFAAYDPSTIDLTQDADAVAFDAIK